MRGGVFTGGRGRRARDSLRKLVLLKYTGYAGIWGGFVVELIDKFHCMVLVGLAGKFFFWRKLNEYYCKRICGK